MKMFTCAVVFAGIAIFQAQSLLGAPQLVFSNNPTPGTNAWDFITGINNNNNANIENTLPSDPLATNGIDGLPTADATKVSPLPSSIASMLMMGAPTPAVANAQSQWADKMGMFSNGREQPQKGSCQKQCVRREVSTFSDAEFTELSRAFHQLNTVQPNESVSWLANLVKIHESMSANTHGNDFFLHWHRYYLLMLERKLQTISPEFCMPYWDWPNMSQNFTRHPAFGATRFGTQGSNGCIQSGPFAGWSLFKEKGCVQRKINSSYSLSSFGVVVALTREAKNFTAFRTSLEVTPHSGPHLAIGGDMTTMLSSADPIFWLHHATVDKLWSDLTYKSTGLDHPDKTTQLPGMLVTISDLDRAEDWCYSYAASTLKIETNVKPPTPISTSFLSMNQHLNMTNADLLNHQITKKTQQAFRQFQENPNSFTTIKTRSSVSAKSAATITPKITISFLVIFSLVFPIISNLI